MRVCVILADGRRGELPDGPRRFTPTLRLDSGEILSPAQAGVLTVAPECLDAPPAELALALLDATAAGFWFGAFGRREVQQARAGRVKSAAKANASRANGRKSKGRPRKEK